ncbi:SDR family NAD(P)-dependent oxidoreductase [Nonomuraea sp. NPDC050680]|uniref:SDR family NAD(P)-dependent oxidoreductase n=1 Tax=Nonomuraea sp. NPDC050680 TaxID=3154630 RepID=UPI0033D76EA7
MVRLGRRPGRSARLGFYAAAKFAIEGLTEVLRQEVAPFGIKVLAVEPGAFRTRAYGGFADELVDEPITDYQPMLAAVRAAMIAELRGQQAVARGADSPRSTEADRVPLVGGSRTSHVSSAIHRNQWRGVDC